MINRMTSLLLYSTYVSNIIISDVKEGEVIMAYGIS